MNKTIKSIREKRKRKKEANEHRNIYIYMKYEKRIIRKKIKKKISKKILDLSPHRTISRAWNLNLWLCVG
jgi:hypothetical protein